MAFPKVKISPLPDCDELLARLRYDPKTGKLFWHDELNGREAFCQKTKNGYRAGSFNYKHYLTHRIIWKMCYGLDPMWIDHINGVREDNRIANLRSIARSDNMKNTKRRIDNSSGTTGVSWNEATGKWRVMISAMGRRSKHIGLYPTLREAIQSRKEAEKTYGYFPNHGRHHIKSG